MDYQFILFSFFFLGEEGIKRGHICFERPLFGFEIN